jgi:hypothetical protein
MFEVKYQPKVDQCSLGAHSVPEDGVEDAQQNTREQPNIIISATSQRSM